MLIGRRLHRLTEFLFLAIAICLALSSPPLAAADESSNNEAASPVKPKAKPKLDRSGRTQKGKASIYAKKFTNRTMADGNKMDPNDDNAASKTLPLGTRARVTNLENGLSTEVTIQDRGPYVPGRIVDLSPAKAEEIGLSTRKGLARVEVTPLEIPQKDGTMKLVEEFETAENETADATP